MRSIEFEPVVRSAPGRPADVHLSLDGVVLCGAFVDAGPGWRHWGVKYALGELPFGSHGDLCFACSCTAHAYSELGLAS